MLKRLHPVAGGVGLAIIITFWTATIVSELTGLPTVVATVKQSILWGFLVLIPALAIAGATGLRLAARRRGPIVAAKRGRMPWIAGNGVLILVPAATYLASAAAAGRFDGWFVAVQAIELVAGGANIILLGLMVRDGLRLGGRLRRPDAASAG